MHSSLADHGESSHIIGCNVRAKVRDQDYDFNQYNVYTYLYRTTYIIVLVKPGPAVAGPNTRYFEARSGRAHALLDH